MSEAPVEPPDEPAPVPPEPGDDRAVLFGSGELKDCQKQVERGAEARSHAGPQRLRLENRQNAVLKCQSRARSAQLSSRVRSLALRWVVPEVMRNRGSEQIAPGTRG